MSKMLQSQLDDDGVMTVWFDQANSSTNTLSPAALDEFDALITALEADQETTGLIIASAKKDAYVSGADLFEMRGMDRVQMQQFVAHGQNLFDRIAMLSIPTVAAINGHCLGGGLELALACTWRVAADKGSINIGLPEIKLGIIPAWGGTTRVTRMLGPTRALSMLLTGKTMPPRKAQRAGIIDEVVRPEVLLAGTRRLLRTKVRARRPHASMNRLIMAVPGSCDLVCRIAQRKTIAKTFGNYPAPQMLIDTVRTACRNGHAPGLRAEREAVMHLAQTDACQNLMGLFFLRHRAKRVVCQKLDLKNSRIDINHAAVVGGGTMGSGIAHAFIRSGISVRLVDVSADAVSAGLCSIQKLLDKEVKAKRLSPLEARQAMQRVSPSTTSLSGGLKFVDLVVEAVAEKIEVKDQVFQMLDRVTRPGAVLASNTSSLSITDLAAVVKNPGRVIGLHFFNPVPMMPLVEVVRTEHSDNEAVAAGVQLSLRLGKTPIVVADAPGFLVNRLLIPYLAEALVMASEGVSVPKIDHAMKKWGMPMGPFELLDHVGIDVALYILQSLHGSLGDRISVPDGIEQIIERGWFGCKSRRGFYEYRKKGRVRPNHEIIELITNHKSPAQDAGRRGRSEAERPVIQDSDGAEEEIQLRLILPMINEAARLLEEGVTDSTETIDLATVLGLGLAPFRGGLMSFAESTGLTNVIRHMDQMAHAHGPRFAPAKALRHVAEEGEPLEMLTNLRSMEAEQTATADIRPRSGEVSRVPTPDAGPLTSDPRN